MDCLCRVSRNIGDPETVVLLKIVVPDVPKGHPILFSKLQNLVAGQRPAFIIVPGLPAEDLEQPVIPGEYGK